MNDLVQAKARVTKTKDPMGWRVLIDGKQTELVISKGLPPKYRDPQMYDLTTDRNELILEAPGVAGVMGRVEQLLTAIGR